MTTLHMETDTVRAVASQIKQVAEALQFQAQALNGSAESVDWAGPNRDEFVNEVYGLVRQIDAQVETGMILAQRVENEVSEWEQVAQGLGEQGGPGQAGLAGIGLGIGAVAGGASDAWFGVVSTKPKTEPTSLPVLAKAMGKTSAGADLIKQAQKNKLTFQLPDGTKIGYTGKDGQLYKISYGDTDPGVLGYQNAAEQKIVLSKGMSDSQAQETMAHEMQHALDYKEGLVIPAPKMPSLTEMQKMNSSEKQKVADGFAKWYESRLTSEYRAWERGHSVGIGDAYDLNHGYRTKENIFTDGTSKASDGYESVYEKQFRDSGNGAEIDLQWKNGHLAAKLAVPQPPSKKKDPWYKIW